MNIAKRIIKEFWFPFFGAILWAIYNIDTIIISLDAFRKFLNVFGPTFFLLSWLIGQYFRIKRNEEQSRSHFSAQTNIAYMSLRLMPTRFQEGIDSGATSFSFENTRTELEKLYALAPDDEARKLVHTIVDNYNMYLNMIRCAAAGEKSLETVNEYHEKHIVKLYEDTVRLKYGTSKQ